MILWTVVPEENHTVTGRLKAVTATILSPDAPQVPTRVTVPSRDSARPPPPSRSSARPRPAPLSVRRANYKVEEPHASSYGSNLFKVPYHTESDFYFHFSWFRVSTARRMDKTPKSVSSSCNNDGKFPLESCYLLSLLSLLFFFLLGNGRRWA